jgi:hypothetical protein
MPKFHLIQSDRGVTVAFDCPGCKSQHSLPVRPRTGDGPSWEWNEDVDRPTISPSLLVSWSYMVDGQDVKHVCHSFIRNGEIQYLTDSTHALSGRTVAIPEWSNYGMPDS